MAFPKADKGRLPALELSAFNVVLRPPQPEDCVEWLGLREKNKRFLKYFEPAWLPDALSEDYFYRRLARQVRDWNSDRGYPFLIFKRETGELIGGINIIQVFRGAAQFASLGYWLDEMQQGHGYMRGAMRRIIYFAHDDLKLHRFNASVIPGNTRSMNTLKRLGFQEEGYARKYVEINNKWQDHKLFGLVLEEFMEKEREE
jgi:ribosomal-protein-alanine N-acetyltransferase